MEKTWHGTNKGPWGEQYLSKRLSAPTWIVPICDTRLSPLCTYVPRMNADNPGENLQEKLKNQPMQVFTLTFGRNQVKPHLQTSLFCWLYILTNENFTFICITGSRKSKTDLECHHLHVWKYLEKTDRTAVMSQLGREERSQLSGTAHNLARKTAQSQSFAEEGYQVTGDAARNPMRPWRARAILRWPTSYNYPFPLPGSKWPPLHPTFNYHHYLPPGKVKSSLCSELSIGRDWRGSLEMMSHDLLLQNWCLKKKKIPLPARSGELTN